jgi:transposase InsO family protein
MTLARSPASNGPAKVAPWPQTNGKVERFNRTLLDEWAYVRAYSSEAERRRRLDNWLHVYNHHRCHTAIGGQPPVTRLDNLPGHHS